MLAPLGNVELGFLLVQAVLLYRILRDLNLIDLDRLLAVIKPPDGSTALVSRGGSEMQALPPPPAETSVVEPSGGLITASSRSRSIRLRSRRMR